MFQVYVVGSCEWSVEQSKPIFISLLSSLPSCLSPFLNELFLNLDLFLVPLCIKMPPPPHPPIVVYSLPPFISPLISSPSAKVFVLSVCCDVLFIDIVRYVCAPVCKCMHITSIHIHVVTELFVYTYVHVYVYMYVCTCCMHVTCTVMHTNTFEIIYLYNVFGVVCCLSHAWCLLVPAAPALHIHVHCHTW